MVSGDVVHAYGSMGHTNVLHTLLAGGVSPPLAKLIVESAKWIRIHYGGPTSLARDHTHFDSGTGQGDPWSTVTFCVAYELRGLLVMQTHQGVGTPWGDMHRLVFSDDAQYPCNGPPGVAGCR